MAIQLPGEGDPLYETWVMLLHGYGYNFYRKDNQARADDQLVRQHACQFIGDAAVKVQKLEADYRKRHVPPVTREHPLPPADRLATQRELRQLGQDIGHLAAEINALGTPPQDWTWRRHRNELDTLKRLVTHDAQFVGAARLLEEAAAKSSALESDQNGTVQRLREHLELLRQLIDERRQLLLVPLNSV
jgi:hypothetical protein